MKTNRYTVEGVMPCKAKGKWDEELFNIKIEIKGKIVFDFPYYNNSMSSYNFNFISLSVEGIPPEEVIRNLEGYGEYPDEDVLMEIIEVSGPYWPDVIEFKKSGFQLKIEGLEIKKEEVETEIPQFFIELENGKFLFNDYGKYRPNLTFILNFPSKPDMESCSGSKYNLETSSLTELRGDYWKSKKGTNCFCPNLQGKHVLLRDNWGGAFNNYRGYELEKLDSIYYRRASSNGGGSGYDWAVVKIGTRQKVSIENI